MTIGQVLQQLRARAGLSQPEVAERAGVSIAAVSNWENDKGVPWQRNLVAYLRVVGVDPAHADTVRKGRVPPEPEVERPPITETLAIEALAARLSALTKKVNALEKRLSKPGVTRKKGV